MLLQNISVERGWVNGRLCEVVMLEDDAVHIRAVDDTNAVWRLTRITRELPFSSHSRTQFPLSLGWAFTIHKVQGLTLSRACIFFDGFFAPGLLYVALSRVRRLQPKTTKHETRYAHECQDVAILHYPPKLQEHGDLDHQHQP